MFFPGDRRWCWCDSDDGFSGISGGGAARGSDDCGGGALPSGETRERGHAEDSGTLTRALFHHSYCVINVIN